MCRCWQSESALGHLKKTKSPKVMYSCFIGTFCECYWEDNKLMHYSTMQASGICSKIFKLWYSGMIKLSSETDNCLSRCGCELVMKKFGPNAIEFA